MLLRCPRLSTLGLAYATHVDSRPYASRELDVLDVSGGRMTALDLSGFRSVGLVHLQRCAQLASLSDSTVRVRRMLIDDCAKVDYSTLLGVPGVRSLMVMGSKRLRGFEALRSHAGLRSISIRGGVVPKRAVAEVAAALNLTRVEATVLPDAEVVDISRELPLAVVSNLRVTARDGRHIPYVAETTEADGS